MSCPAAAASLKHVAIRSKFEMFATSVPCLSDVLGELIYSGFTAGTIELILSRLLSLCILPARFPSA